jgi:TPR repeat protein
MITLFNNLKIPKKEFLLKYSDSKILNNIAVYYYKNLDLELSEFYLLEALKKAKTESVKELINFNMGILNLFINSHKSKILAVKYFEKTKLKEAYYNLGISYYNGFGVKENDKKAFNYFKKASDMNLNIAKENYEKMLKMGFK